MGQIKKGDVAYVALIAMMGSGLIGFAFKFTTYFENWYWLPSWPNFGDAVFIVLCGLVLLGFAVKEFRRLEKSRDG